MNFVACMVSLLLGILILPHLQAFPTESSPEQSECDLEIQANDKEIRGVYKADHFIIYFHAALENDKIQATSTMANSGGMDAGTTVSLTLTNAKGRMIPGIERMVVESAEKLAESTDCEIPNNLNRLHEQLADKLFQCTDGLSQLAYSIMYLETVVGSANRLCSQAESICTVSPKYTFGNGAFICQEDLEDLFPKETLTAKELTYQSNILLSDKNNADKAQERNKRWWCPLGRGSYHGCCGNYGGCCYYRHWACYLHDRACTNCGHWLCGPMCRPD